MSESTGENLTPEEQLALFVRIRNATAGLCAGLEWLLQTLERARSQDPNYCPQIPIDRLRNQVFDAINQRDSLSRFVQYRCALLGHEAAPQVSGESGAESRPGCPRCGHVPEDIAAVAHIGAVIGEEYPAELIDELTTRIAEFRARTSEAEQEGESSP